MKSCRGGRDWYKIIMNTNETMTEIVTNIILAVPVFCFLYQAHNLVKLIDRWRWIEIHWNHLCMCTSKILELNCCSSFRWIGKMIEQGIPVPCCGVTVSAMTYYPALWSGKDIQLTTVHN